MNKALNLVEDYDYLIAELPTIKTQVYNELLNEFSKNIISTIESTLKVKVVLLFNKIASLPEGRYQLQKIIKPTWIFIFNEKPNKTILAEATKRGWKSKSHQSTFCLIRPGKIICKLKT